jgi:hypothetical protein
MPSQETIKLTKEQEEAFAKAFPSITIEQQLQMIKGALPIFDVSESARLQKCKDDAAIREGYQDWNDMLKCLFDPQCGNPGMYTLDDIVNHAIKHFR